MAPRETPLTARTLVKAGIAALVAVACMPDHWASALRPFLAGGHSVGFWLSQAALLALLGLLTWGMNSLWDRFCEAPVSFVIGAAIDAALRVTTPLVRLARRGLLLAWSRRPAHLREPEGLWRALLLAAWACAAAILLAQHLHRAHEAASTKGIHRRELPSLAAGVLHWRWRGVCLRAQDGAPP